MATLIVEGVPPGLLSRLADTAVANGRCVNTEVILLLMHHVRKEPAGKDSARTGLMLCPLRPRIGAEVPPGRNVSWGDPG